MSQYMLSKTLKKSYLYGFVKFLNKNNFLFYNKRSFTIFKMKKKIKNTVILNKRKKILINSDIAYLMISSCASYFYIYDSNRNLRVYSPFTYKKIRTFFLDLNLVFLQKSMLVDNIIYVVHTNYSLSEIYKPTSNKVFLAILNLDECKYVNIIQLKNLWFCENLVKFINNEKIIVVADNDRINILNFDWNNKKIFKKIIINRIEICILISDTTSILIGDRNGFLNLFEFRFSNSLSTDNNFDNLELYTISKSKTWLFNHNICFGFYLKKNEVILNLFGFSEIFHLNFKSQKKKNIQILNKKYLYVVDLIIVSKFDKFLIITPKNLMFYSKSICKIKIFNIQAYRFLNFFDKKWISSKLKNKFQIRLFPLLFLSNCSFLLTSPGNNYQIFTINETPFKSNFIIKNFFKNEIDSKEIGLILEVDALGKRIFYLKNFKSFSTLANSSINLKNSNFVRFIGLQFKYLYFTKKQSQFCIDRKGKQIAVILSDFYIKIRNNFSFTYKKKKNLNITLFCNKKISAISISENGLYLALAYSNVVSIWDLFLEIKRIKTISVDLQDSVYILKFLSMCADSKLIISSYNEIMLFNTKNFSLIWKIKLKIIEISIDKWSDVFIIKTKCISTKAYKITETIVVFNSYSCMPIKIIDPMLFFNKSIMSFSFSYFNNINGKKSLIYLDSSFELNKIFF